MVDFRSNQISSLLLSPFALSAVSGISSAQLFLQFIGHLVQLGGITGGEFFGRPCWFTKKFLQEQDPTDLTAARFANFNASRFAFQHCLFNPRRFITLEFQAEKVSGTVYSMRAEMDE